MVTSTVTYERPPSLTCIQRYLVIPISEHQDTVGTMARTVKDAAYLLQAIAGRDRRDNYTSAIPSGPLPDYVKACDFGALKGARLGVPRNAIEAFSGRGTRPIIRAFDASLKTLEAAGATIVESNFTALDEFFNSQVRISLGITFSQTRFGVLIPAE